jgi:signal transduction histidine kinase
MSEVKYPSLFRRLLLGFMVVVFSIWFLILAWDMHESHTTSQISWQHEVKFATQRIFVIMKRLSDRPEEMYAVARELEAVHYTGYKEKNFYAPLLQIQVWKGSRLIYASAGLGLPATAPMAKPADQPIKDKWVTWTETDPVSEVTVRVAQEAIGWWLPTVSSIGYFLLPLLCSLPFLLVPAWFIIKVGMHPLTSIVNEIEHRSGSDLSPLISPPYKELSPLIHSINRLMGRLTERQEREQDFLIEAAHELKTPLAVIQINADSLLSTRDPQRLIEASNGLSQGVYRATHTVHQLLALRRSDDVDEEGELIPLDLVDLVRNRLALAGPVAELREVDIDFEAPETCMLALHRESVASLIDNLVDNAVKYSPLHGRVVVTVETGKNGTQLSVTDEGPGISPAFHEKVFERFFRLDGQNQPGSGLGLAIVERAAARNKATVNLDNLSSGTGLIVVITFPAPDEHTEPNNVSTSPERSTA